MSLEDFKKRVWPVKNKLYRFALKLMGDKEEAEDVLQDVLLKVWDRRAEMDTYANIEAWCMTLIRNRSLDRRKSRQYQTASFKEGADIAAADKNPYQSAELGNHVKNIRLIMDALPDKQRQVIHLRDIEGMTYQEIAEIMLINLSQVKINLFRARTAIRTKLLNAEAYGTR